jgi:hypothetical protein
MVYDDGPIYSMLTGKPFTGFILSSVPTTGYIWTEAESYVGFPLAGQYFCSTSGAIRNKGSQWNEDFTALTPCNCSAGHCGNGDISFGKDYWPGSPDNEWAFGPNGEPPWFGWQMSAGNRVAWNNSQSDTIPLTGWYEWGNSGPTYAWYNDPAPPSSTFVLTPFS